MTLPIAVTSVSLTPPSTITCAGPKAPSPPEIFFCRPPQSGWAWLRQALGMRESTAGEEMAYSRRRGPRVSPNLMTK